ncbi:MAG: hypothetical protein ACWA5W_10210 [Phycisphaerales bacterium]
MIQVIERSNSYYDMREFPNEQQQAERGKVPHWSKSHVLPTEKEKKSYRNGVEVVAGWPYPSWYGEYSHQSYAFDTEQSNFALLLHKRGWQYPLALPFKPCMPGFVQNLLFYATLVMGAHLVFLRLVKRKKTKNQRRLYKEGLCVACAYDITGLTTCPECGQPVKPKPTSPSNRT